MRDRPFFGARIDDRMTRVSNSFLRKRGWQECVRPYFGYGTPEQIRILARVILEPSHNLGIVKAAHAIMYQRGWRNFIGHAAVDAQVRVHVGKHTIEVQADRRGYVDIRIKNPGLEPGWNTVLIEGSRGSSAIAKVHIIGEETTFGIVSDIDDTILSTWLPRPMLAAWNSLVLTEQARQAVPGMARWFQQLLKKRPGSPVIYISTGTFNTYPMIRRFQKRHGFPPGAMLLTDWAPTNTGWFRSGSQHKRTALRELARDMPNVRWLLVGDDGQHDPDLYAEFAELQPKHVLARAIRELTPGEGILAHGLRLEHEMRWKPDAAPEFRAPDGDSLAAKLKELEIIDL